MKKNILLFLFLFSLANIYACKDLDFPADIEDQSICDSGDCQCESNLRCFCVSGECTFSCAEKNCYADCAREMPSACTVDAPTAAITFKCNKDANCEIDGGPNSDVECYSTIPCKVNLGENSKLSCGIGSCTGSVKNGSIIQPSVNTAVEILCKGPNCALTCKGLKCNIQCDSGPATQCDETRWSCGPC